MSVVVIKTNYGDVVLALNEEKAPVTCANFKSYVDSGFYTDTLFHRVIPNFMIQGGGFDVSFDKKSCNDPINNEASNGLVNVRGSIAMARTAVPDSATSQFFINCIDNKFLNFKSETPSEFGYCVFGEVTEGIEVVDKISKVATGSRQGHADVPLENVIIESITVSE